MMNKKGSSVKIIFEVAILVLVVVVMVWAFILPAIANAKNAETCTFKGGECKLVCGEGFNGIYSKDCFKNKGQCCIKIKEDGEEPTNIDIPTVNNTNNQQTANETKYDTNGFPYPMLFIPEITDGEGLPIIENSVLYAGEEDKMIIQYPNMHKDYQCKIRVAYINKVVGDRVIKEVTAPCIAKTEFSFVVPDDNIGEFVRFYVDATYNGRTFDADTGEAFIIKQR